MTDIQKASDIVTGFKDLAEELRKEVDRLKAAREEDRARLDRIEEQIKAERNTKWAAIQHIRNLYA